MNIPAHLLGRIFLAIPFLVFGILHFMGADQMAGPELINRAKLAKK